MSKNPLPHSSTKSLIHVIWISILSILLAFLIWDRYQSEKTFEELNVQRINVIEPDGMPRIILTNKEKLPGLYIEGIEYPHPTRDFGGLIFFNNEGDESGASAVLVRFCVP